MAANTPATTIRLVVKAQGPAVEDGSAILLKIESPYCNDEPNNVVEARKSTLTSEGNLAVKHYQKNVLRKIVMPPSL
jgi:hypothetical protein